MAAVAIDLNTLDDLFDNQKRIDDLFNAVFDDDLLFDSSPVESDYTPSSSSQSSRFDADEYLAFNTDETVERKRNIVYLIMPVALEITILYYALSYFM